MIKHDFDWNDISGKKGKIISTGDSDIEILAFIEDDTNIFYILYEKVRKRKGKILDEHAQENDIPSENLEMSEVEPKDMVGNHSYTAKFQCTLANYSANLMEFMGVSKEESLENDTERMRKEMAKSLYQDLVGGEQDQLKTVSQWTKEALLNKVGTEYCFYPGYYGGDPFEIDSPSNKPEKVEYKGAPIGLSSPIKNSEKTCDCGAVSCGYKDEAGPGHANYCKVFEANFPEQFFF